MADMIQFVAHRVNDPAALESLSPELGAEIDIRSQEGRLILHHEPNTSGPLLTDFLDAYARTRKDRLLILNPKEDGHDVAVIKMLSERDIENYFFLDLTMPSTIRMAVKGWERRIALRVSEYETAASARTLAGKADWIWLDSFTGEPPAAEVAEGLRKDFKICLVSPELEGFPVSRIKAFRFLLPHVDAVCTKHPDRWNEP
jgi:hypothetical protein